ncbi:TRAPP trafficking subunit Trs65-domain-containing protein [Mrakia frigida]|uniref:TRAPP trafficking subunit Trs65-domain-containing protein n=1 Tax=Mrakia frigida TaxID=29902 RepID=UPI003FCC00C9
MSLSSLFHSSSLRIHVPPEPISPPPADATPQTRTEWIANLIKVGSRKLAFYDEQLGLYASVRLTEPSLDRDEPSEEVVTFLSHLQITLESTYISALPPSPSTQTQQGSTYPFPPTPGLVPSTPTATLSPPRITTSSPSASPGPTPSTRNFPPQTPNPTPSTGSSEERRYARAEGVPVWSATWGNTTKKRKEIILGRIDGEGSWIAVWELEAPVAFLRTRIDNPLLCLTVSMTLREKPTRGIIAGFELPVEEAETPVLSRAKGDFVTARDLEDVNLLDDFGPDVSFPFSRLRPITNNSPNSPTNPSNQGPTTNPPVSLISLPTLRKSFRSVLSVASGLHLRMRTVFLPQLLLDDYKATSGDDDPLDDEDEDRKVVMSVEVEATGGGTDGMGGENIGFEIESVEVKVGGVATGAKAELLEPPCANEGEGKTGFPLPLHSLDQYNLLYAVSSSLSSHYNPSATPLPPPTPMSTITLPSLPSTVQQQQGRHVSQQHPPPPSVPSESVRPVSIAVVGRPFIDVDGVKEYPTASFVSRWNCTLDLSHLDATSDKRISLPAVAGVLSSHSHSSPSSSAAASRPTSMIAGNRRFSAASLTAFSHNNNQVLLPSSNQQQLNGHLPPLPPPPSSSSNGLPPPTPAFPSYPPSQAQPPLLPPSQLAFANSGNSPQRPTSAMDARRRTTLGENPPPTPAPGRPFSNAGGGGNGWDQGTSSTTAEADGVLISISVLLPEGGKRAIKVLEPFSLEVFVFNKSSRTRRFSIGVPEKRRRRDPALAIDRTTLPGQGGGDVGMGESHLHAHLVEHLSSSTPLIPLENHIRVGPLLPATSQSVRMRFMALEEGVWEVETLQITGVGEGFAINLKSVCNVVVHG